MEMNDGRGEHMRRKKSNIDVKKKELHFDPQEFEMRRRGGGDTCTNRAPLVI